MFILAICVVNYINYISKVKYFWKYSLFLNLLTYIFKFNASQMNILGFIIYAVCLYLSFQIFVRHLPVPKDLLIASYSIFCALSNTCLQICEHLCISLIYIEGRKGFIFSSKKNVTPVRLYLQFLENATEEIRYQYGFWVYWILIIFQKKTKEISKKKCLKTNWPTLC